MNVTTDVAVVGMSARFPGASDVGEYWTSLRTGRCSIRRFDAETLAASGVPVEERQRPDYVPAKGFLDDADRFEAGLFGFSAPEATVADPQHRLLLESAWAAFEDAGYDPSRAPAATGVFVGGGQSEHMIATLADAALRAQLGDLQLRILTDREFLAPWLSYRFGLTGPSVTVQTACSTSLTAVHLAARALLVGECDVALAGGVSVDTPAAVGYRYQEGGIFAADGRCRPFAEAAAGTVSGCGAGLVVLRRWEDAVADGDPIRAVIHASAMTNDGALRAAFSAPGVDGHSRAITEAWAAAGTVPARAQYLELHGTGTALGDQIEAEAAGNAIGSGNRCAVGSVKGNVGHLDAAAGVAGLIKVILMLEHRTLVPTAGVDRPMAAVEPNGPGPLRLVTETEQWPAPPDGHRLGGVSGLGIGGTDVHVVVGQADPVEPAPTARVPRAEVLPLSATGPAQLAATAERLAEALRRPGAPCVADVAYTLRTARAALPARAVVVASTPAEAVAALEQVAAGRAPALPGWASHYAAWVSGADVDWPATVGRRVNLPGTLLRGERFGWRSLGDVATMPTDRTPESGRPSEQVVLAMICEVLGLADGDDLDRSFFAAGGDSLGAVALAGRIGDRFGLDVDLDSFFDAESLHDLAARVARDDRAASDDLVDALLSEAETASRASA
ncbi:hypothetical protein KBX08_01390 [Micromonospora sp. H61]|uniref:beta-ketoacyl synthase N-terminal-like domain-containing protein n=1 Tax=Micromonospora sp. H61 TaxID=2824888 RepID=UPI001B36F355|nr:beta-ketoacyl synthase N-terminal-like domain-containing protein [Micromonospora sp. H61]MBQ0988747.1 hypothetical protein [Micromonospora sp. H61]